MPVVIAPASFDIWLDPKRQSAGPVEALLAAQQPPEYRIYPVARTVNSPSVDKPELLEPLEGA
jgi:putative SOS response-associated peptidase YedK